ncbi:MAG TPA: GT4 family glycosyltransferase PelF [Candidatus Eremiobacteraeota bacterium]|nr:MAG: N,N'-diacetylbacillosaminyl-diphospho-undecaprenol alpha-1,3-N-acetylgalactosaminyltransferase [bacterium ADurb.Bin363]HPZ07658.1 GT4 family glycosyltransferase PelF [Candidatus Eremiobacteraeota bacterium]
MYSSTSLASVERKQNMSTGERIEEIFKYILSFDPSVREKGRTLLSELKNTFELQKLAELARERDFKIKYYVLEQLGKFQYKSTIKSLIQFLSDENILIQRKAERILDEIEIEDKYDYLLSLIREGSLSTRLYSIKTLGLARQVNAVLPLVHLLKDKESEIRYHTIDALRLIGDPRSDEEIIKCLKDETPEVCYGASIYCGTRKVKKSCAYLYGLLKDENPKIRTSAVWALGQIKDKKWTGKLKDFLTREEDENVRCEILKALYSSGQFNLLKNDPSLRDGSYSTKAIGDWYFIITSREKEKISDICLFIEGSYPYVTGGVASWVKDILDYCKDLTFSIVSIRPSSAEIKEFKHPLPSNVLYYTEINLFDLPEIKSQKTDRIKEKLNIIFDFIKNIDKQKINNFETICTTLGIMDKLQVNIHDLLFSREAWRLIHKFYEINQDLPFLEFFWSYRAMVLPVYNIINATIPRASLYYTALTGYAGLAAVLARIIYNKPLLLTEHGIYHRERMIEISNTEWIYQMKDEGFTVTEMLGGLKKIWYHMYQSFSYMTYKFADRITTLFKENAAMQIKAGANPEKIIIIPNGIDISHFEHIKKGNITDKDSFVIALIGRVVEIKDIKTFIWAARQVCDKFSGKIKFLIMGSYEEDPLYAEECMSLAKLLNLDEVMEFTGNVDLKEYFKDIDLVVLTSISEGQPLSLMEAMSCGIPCVATDVGSCKALLYGKDEEDEKSGSCGIITKVHSSAETANAIINILSNPEVYKNMAETGKSRIRNHYQKKNVFNLYRAEFSRFLDK